MAEGFVPLAALLLRGERPAAGPAAAGSAAISVAAAATSASAPGSPLAPAMQSATAGTTPGVRGGGHAAAWSELPEPSRLPGELARMRLAALEALERHCARLLRELADDVLGRELQLAGADLEALARRALASFADDEPVSIAVSLRDAERVHVSLPVRVDPALSPGDLIVTVRDGALESHFAFRAESVVERVLASDNT